SLSVRFNLGNSCNRGEYPQNGVEIRDGVVNQRLVVLTVALAMMGLFKSSAHTRQRGPQIVRHVVRDLSYLLHQYFDAIEHQVEVFCNLIPFVTRPAEWNTFVEAALHDRTTGCVNRIYSSHRAACDHNACHSSENEDQPDARYESDLDIPCKCIEVVDVSPHQQMFSAR